MEQSYKEKYEDILARLERAKYDNEVCDERFCCVIDEIIPELAESEDEKVRKRLIADFGTIGKKEWGGLEVKDILAWLEKQKPADKIEPKFYEGDWLIFDENHNSVYQVERIDNYRYYLRHYLGGTMSVHFDNELVRLWTIEDAKDGDVLATSAGAFIYNGNNGGGSCPGCYCGINTLGRFQTGVEHHWTGKKVYPATKEQRDTLLKAMVDAGYTFDFEDKKLKKIEPKTEENKGNVGGISSNWSEEDERMFNSCCAAVGAADYYTLDDKQDIENWLKSIKDRMQPKQEWSEEDEINVYNIIHFLEEPSMLENNEPCKKIVIDWLKSLRPQNRWKPSDEQIVCLSDAIEHYNSLGYPASKLKELLDDLKELKGEV